MGSIRHAQYTLGGISFDHGGGLYGSGRTASRKGGREACLHTHGSGLMVLVPCIEVFREGEPGWTTLFAQDMAALFAQDMAAQQ